MNLAIQATKRTDIRYYRLRIVMAKTLKEKIEKILYGSIIKRLMAISKLGRTTMSGQADSGLNIDYMYRNKPKGITNAGKIVDKILLNLPSVQATRHKKDIIGKILLNDIANNIILQRKTRIVDIASGPARYIVDAITTYNQGNIEVLCLDSDKRSINFGKVIAGKKPIRYAKANVFKLKHLKTFAQKIFWTPNIVIATGFFEILSDEIFEKLLREIYAHIDKDGLVLFTAQANNPSKKLMSKIGKKQDGTEWNVYFRTPEYLREIMLKIGFRNVVISVDKWGIYEYCTGRKS